MHSHQVLKIFSGFLFLILIAVCIVPVSADTGAVTITYRGAGGYYVGDTIAFDGKNTLGNATVVRITGPGLPAEGVPPYNLTGTPGTGNTAIVDDMNSWAFYWDISRSVGVDHLYTAKYTLTAYDANHPDVTASVPIMLKKPEFYVAMTPNPAKLDDYVTLVGYSEKGAANIEINVLDAQQNKVHTYLAATDASGDFNYGFHVDMAPGDYTVNIGSPSMAKSITKTLTVNATPGNAAVVATVTPAATPTDAAGTLMISSKPTGAAVYLDTVMVGNTPLTLNTVTPGTHTVEVRSPGYLPSSVGVTVAGGKSTEITPELVKSPSGAPLSPLTAVFGCIIGAFCIIALRSHRK
jgi:PEGA domain.